MIRSILAVNRGSSSVKFGLFTFEPEPQALSRGTVEVRERGAVLDLLRSQIAGDVSRHPLAGVAHRLVHGGPGFVDPQIVDGGLIARLRQIAYLAPNHLPDEIDLVEELLAVEPSLRQVVCFDTAFHARLPEVAQRLPVPDEYAAAGVRRYGFHGLSYTYLAGELQRRAGTAPDRIVLAHLGNGSSLAAVRGGQAVDTTMGFTPIGGVVMSTRSGDLDPGVVTHIARLKGLDADRLEDVFSHRSGLAAISGGLTDMRELLAREETDRRCRLAVEIYCYEIRKRIGSYAAALGGLDALVFSGGIGQHAHQVRARICRDLAFIGVHLDEAANAANAPVVSPPASRVAVHVIPTDEEIVMARAACGLLH
jgi:acetate kinase